MTIYHQNCNWQCRDLFGVDNAACGVADQAPLRRQPESIDSRSRKRLPKPTHHIIQLPPDALRNHRIFNHRNIHRITRKLRIQIRFHSAPHAFEDHDFRSASSHLRDLIPPTTFDRDQSRFPRVPVLTMRIGSFSNDGSTAITSGQIARTSAAVISFNVGFSLAAMTDRRSAHRESHRNQRQAAPSRKSLPALSMKKTALRCSSGLAAADGFRTDHNYR